jgi:hypothetical protein
VPDEIPSAILGSEKAVSNPSLRLRGRPDWSARTGADEIEVVDYKSGRIKDREGHLLDEHVAQIQLYALMMEAAFPGTTVHPFIEQVGRMEVPWDSAKREQIGERLSVVSSQLPAGEILPASELASPGSHCKSCRLRPACAAYLEQAPDWWRADHDSPRPLPTDVWGSVTEVLNDLHRVSLRITDAAGRRVRVDGLRESHVVSTISRGDFVWLFDLEASEDTQQHGAIVHPRNFHQDPPGPRWKQARQVRVFLSPGSAPIWS